VVRVLRISPYVTLIFVYFIISLREWTENNAFGFTVFTLIVHAAKKLELIRHFYVNS